VCVISALFSCGSAPFDAFFPSLIKSLAGMNEIGIGQSNDQLATCHARIATRSEQGS
jgi:hypothetical protein